jgi:Spy/CpxP family protein refolding chaperone
MRINEADGGNGSKGRIKIVLLILLIFGLGWVSWSLYAKYNPKPARPTGDLLDGPPSPEQRRAQMLEIMNQLKLSDDQQRKMNALWAKGDPTTPEEWRDRMNAMRNLTTPEQQDQFRQIMASRMAQRMERVHRMLSPQDFAAYQKRIMARMQGRGGGGGRGSGPGGANRPGGARPPAR